MTGAPSFEYDDEREDMFKLLLEGERRRYIMTAGIDHKSVNETERIEEIGLVADHCYGILKVREIKDKQGGPV